jgi:hypothetical protein
MTTKTDVMNRTLILCDQPTTASFDDTSTWVTRVRNRFIPMVRKLLERHPWNFASARQALEQQLGTPIGRDFAYNKPGTCLRIIRINDTGDPDDDRPQRYDDEAGQILTNLDPCYLFFVSSLWINKEGAWPQIFADAVSSNIASDVYGAFGKNSAQRERLDKMADKDLGDAKAWDAAQKSFKPNPMGTWARARAGNSRYRYRV